MSIELDSYIAKPFPELVNVEDKLRVVDYIRETVMSKVIGIDLAKKLSRVDIKLLRTLIKTFYAEPGMILNVDPLSRNLSRRKLEVDRHIFMLEFFRLIRIIKNYRPSKLAESKD